MTAGAAPAADASLAPPPEIATLVELLVWRAARQGGERLVDFLADDGVTVAGQLTFAALDRRARALAAWLQAEGAVGQRAFLLYPPGLDYLTAFVGCLYAGVVAVPAYPPQPNRTLARIEAIAANATPAFALTTTALLERLGAAPALASGLRGMRWLATDAVPDGAETGWHAPDVDPRALAFLQYTSGSTGAAKGVMVTHANLIDNSRLIYDTIRRRAAWRRAVSWLPPYHDLGLICGILQPIFAGGHVTLMSPLTFLQRPVRWLSAIAETGADASGAPNFAYDLCVERVTPAQRAGLDLSRWRIAVSGAEPVRPETMARFTAAFAPCGFDPAAFVPAYGLAEATLFVAGSPRPEPPRVAHVTRAGEQTVPVPAGTPGAVPVVACGPPAGRQRVRIVDPATARPCPDGVVGEIWVAGQSVAAGYWNDPEATAAAFQARTADGDGPFLRTGDLGFLAGGEIHPTARLKDLIIVDGRNHWPQDVERTAAASHPALRPNAGVAFAVDRGGRERLVVVHEVERPRALDADPIVAAIRRAVTVEHGIGPDTIVLVRPGSLPKTSSGKLQRFACRAAFGGRTLEALACWSADRPAEVA